MHRTSFSSRSQGLPARSLVVIAWVAPLVLASLAAPAAAEEIHDAVKAGDLARVRSLIEQQPTLKVAVDSSKRTPLHLAALGGDTEMMAAVFSEQAMRMPDFLGLTALYLAGMESGEATAWLLERGADLGARTRMERQTPLHWAAETGKADAVRVLIERGAEVDAADVTGSTPLHLAGRGGRPQAASVLLEAGADPDRANMVGVTPLMRSAAAGSVEVVELLLSYGAKATSTSRLSGQTALHLAALNGHAEIIEILLAAGLDRSLRDRKGRTAADLAREHGRSEALELLQP